MGLLDISAVVISHNSGKFISACLESLENQSVKFRQVVVVDNHSIDNSIDIIAEFGGVTLIPQPFNKGYAEGANIGIRACDADLVLVANADIILDQHFNSAVIDMYSNHADLAMLSPLILRFDRETIDSAGQGYSKALHPVEIGYNRKLSDTDVSHMEIFSVCGAATVFRKESLEQLKLGDDYYDKDFFIFWEDFDIGWRSWLYGQNHLFCRKAVVYHYRSGSLERNFMSRFALSLGRPAEIKYHLIKNRYLTLIKNFRWTHFWWTIPFIVVRDILWVGALTLTAPKIIIKLLKSFGLFKKALEKRKLIKKNG